MSSGWLLEITSEPDGCQAARRYNEIERIIDGFDSRYQEDAPPHEVARERDKGQEQ
ncbi:hypothetical protein D3C73_1338160 [compost metagenome]